MSLSQRRRRRNRTISQINVTNLVDITFALLIIFMITAPMMTQGVQVDLPRGDTPNVESKEYIQVTIDEQRNVYINQKRISLSSFERQFRREFNNRPHVPVFINADKQVPYGIVIHLITKIQDAGAVKLGFLTQPPEKDSP